MIFGVLALLAALWFTVDYASRRHSRAMTIRRDLELGVRRLYQALAAVSLVPKLKLVLAFYQSVAVLPTVYNVKLSHTYYKWTGFLNVFDIDWSNFAIPGACLEGGYRSRLLLRSLGPLVLIICVFGFAFAVNVGRALIGRDRSFAQLEGKRKMFSKALVNALPPVLLVSLVLCAPTASAIFKTWDCVAYEEDSVVPGEKRVTLFLRSDLRTTCSTYVGNKHTVPTEYAEITSTAWVFAIIYSIMFPAIFLAVLLPSRKTLQQRRSTQLVRATGFLHREYEPQFFCAVLRLEPGRAGGCPIGDSRVRRPPLPAAPLSAQGGSRCSCSSASSSWAGCSCSTVNLNMGDCSSA